MRIRLPKRDDSGMSLVELIVVIIISALLLTVIASLFGNSLNVQQRATERDLATGKANAAELQLTNALRDSVSVTLYPTFTNHLSKPQTQLNLTQESESGLVCQVWIWEDRADGSTLLYHQSYRNYATDPIPGSTAVGEWRTNAGTGRHIVSNSGVGGVQPATAHFTFDVGGGEGDTSVVITGGGLKQGLIKTNGVANPCAAGW